MLATAMANFLLNRQFVASNGANNMTGTNVVLQDVEIDLQSFARVSYEIRITGTPVGTLTLEGTNQADPAIPGKAKTGVTFVTLPAAVITPALPAVAGAAVNYIGDLVTAARFVRLRYVNTSGTGTLDVYVNAEQNP